VDDPLTATRQAPATAVARTPAERFDGLPEFDYEPRYRSWRGLRLAHLDEGDGAPVLLLHGEPTWSFLFRRMIPPLRAAGLRCVAPDYPGFGRSDTPTAIDWDSYDRHTAACLALIERLDLRDITLIGHDWGGPIGLRLATTIPDRFARFVLIDTPFFTGRQTMPPVWWQAHDHLARNPDVAVGTLVRAGCASDPSADILAAYDAPFHSAAAKAGVRAFPLRVLPRAPDLPAARACWRTLKAMRKDDRPTLTLWGESDVLFPLELGRWVTGALRRDDPIVLAGAGHFLPEDRGAEAAAVVLDWLADL
jgi:haloalkane dehalogenase